MRLNNSFTVNRWGLIGATLVFLTAFTPTLLAWPWAYTGVIAGIGALLGWAVGVGLRALIPGEPGRAGPGALLASVGVAILVAAVARGWNIEQAQLLGLAPPAWGTGLASVGLGLCVATALIAVFRHRQARIVLAVIVLVPALGITVVGPSRVLSAGEKLDSEDPLPAGEAPTAPQRSGSADSHVDWATLGEQGAKFVNGGLDAAELEQATGRPAAEPIRLYAGRAAGDTHQARAQVIIDELERTNAAERDVLLVMLTPGNGWVSDPAAHGLELLYDGNTAIVAQQYSTQPSAFHMLDTTEVERSGTEFILPILRWWEELPVERRPLFYIYGESLGVTAAEAALTSPHNVAQRVDGVLLAGPPGVNPVYQDTVARRVDGTPAAAPIIAGEDSPQFATDAEAIRALDGFSDTRVLYVQHPSDAVVWWHPAVAWHRPDWLAEPAVGDRLDQMRWLPGITSLLLVADMPFGLSVDHGHGHRYGDAVLPGFVALDDNLDTADEKRVQDAYWAGVD